MTEKDLGFIIFKELFVMGLIENNILASLLDNQSLTTLDQVEQLLFNFSLNINPVNDVNFEDAYDDEEEYYEQPQENITKKNKKRKLENPDFKLTEENKTEYTKLINNCKTISCYVKNCIVKILSNIKVTNIEKLPLNAFRFKNSILSIVKNQDLIKLANNIIHIDQDKLADIIVDGILYDFIIKNIIIIQGNGRIQYDFKQVEYERFKLAS